MNEISLPDAEQMPSKMLAQIAAEADDCRKARLEGTFGIENRKTGVVTCACLKFDHDVIHAISLAIQARQDLLDDTESTLQDALNDKVFCEILDPEIETRILLLLQRMREVRA